MSNPRNFENQGLPSGWQQRPDGYYYEVPLGAERAWDGKGIFFLGRSLPQAYRAWASRMSTTVAVKTVGDLLDRYGIEVVPTKAIATQEGNTFGIVRIKSILGTLPISDVTRQVVLQYFDQRQHKIAARREIEILSHAYTKAIEWGYSTRHPFKGDLMLPAEETRKRYVENWEVAQMLALRSKRKSGSVLAIQAYIRLMLLTGLRRVDLLRIKTTSLGEDGIHVAAGSTRESAILLWTEELRAAVALALNSRPAETSTWLFCKADGAGYFNSENGRADGWASIWERFVDRALSETDIAERFTEHDLKAKFVIDNRTAVHSQGLSKLSDARARRRFDARRPNSAKPIGAS